MHNKKVYDIKIAIQKLKNYCALQEKSEWDVIQKMKDWGLIKSSQDHILKLLILEKYIDNERYCKSFCSGKFKIKKWGKIKIQNELIKKNISEFYIKKGLEEIDELDYLKELKNLFDKKKKSIIEKNHFIKNKKIAFYLINKGYERNLVWDKIKESEKNNY